MLGTELWESKFNGLLNLVKEYSVDVWEIRTHKLYDSGSGSGQQLHCQFSPGDLAVIEGQRNGKFIQNGKLGHSCVRVTKGRLYDSRVRDHVVVHLGLNVSNSAHNAMAAI